MKRVLLLMILSCFTAVGFAQTTYYWVGGASGSWSSANSWSSSLGGAGGARATRATSDILIFDGNNIGGGATGIVTALPSSNEEVAQLELRNNAILNLARTSNGTSYFYVNQAVSVSNNSILNVNGDSGVMVLVLQAASSSIISGQLNVLGTSANRVSAQGADVLSFAAGSSSTISSGGSSFSSVTGTNPSIDRSVKFLNGSTLVWKPITATGNPFPNSVNNIVYFEAEAIFRLEGALVSNFFSNRQLPNLVVGNSQVVTAAGNPYSVNSITVESGSTFNIPASGMFPVIGNITVNTGASFGVAAINESSNLSMIGNGSQQVIGGGGTFAPIGAFSVGANAQVKLETNLEIRGASTSNILGTLDVGSFFIGGSADIQLRSSGSETSNATITLGSNSVVLEASKFASGINLANVSVGALVTGNGIQPNTYIVNTSTSTSTIILSKPAVGTFSSLSGSVVISNNPTTLVLNNTGGIEGVFTTTGSKNYGNGSNFTFNSVTASPFYSGGSSVVGNITINAAVTTNRTITINGNLTLNNAKLTVAEGNVLNFSPTATFDGTFGNNAYISTASNTSSTTVGRVRLTDLASSKLIPVGTATHYVPVTLVPTAVSTFEINAFEGATANAAPNGTALTAAQKARMVDAVWNINRTAGSGDATVTLGWDATLEGADFATFGNAQIGIASFTSGAYGAFSGTGDAANNTATLTTGAFPTQFIVGEANTTLPLKLLSFTGKESLNSVKLAWQTTSEVNLKNYVLQHRTATGFQDIYTVVANNQAGIFNYGYTHLNPANGVNYYRLVGVDLDGTTQTSDAIPVTFTSANAVAVYPNPVNNNTVTVSGVVSGDVIRILNIQGQVIATQKANGSSAQEINLQNVQSGTYILSIENAGKVTSTKKVIKI